MGSMTSSGSRKPSRKPAEERREEILSAAAAIAVEDGLERITLRAVADRLGVRPGLITHYFPAVEDLVVEAFERAAVLERERFFPSMNGRPFERLAHFLGHIERGASVALARLWLNARHLVRFMPGLERALREQDALDHARLRALLEEGVAVGDFADVDVEAACVRIFIAIDGCGSYVNSGTAFADRAHGDVEADVTAWALGLDPAALRQAIARATAAARVAPDAAQRS